MMQQAAPRDLKLYTLISRTKAQLESAKAEQVRCEKLLELLERNPDFKEILELLGYI